MLEDLKLKIEEFLKGLSDKLAVDLIELNVRHQNKTIVVDVIVDHPAGGITIDECGYLNKRLSREIEERQLIPGEYLIHVSSPGIDRPLKTINDFKRVLGKKVHFHLTALLKNKLEYEGVIKDVDQQNVQIDVKAGILVVPLGQIQKAIQVF